ncbi:hypothetical protein ACSBR1_015473 [Camellia fascicularis]
MLGYGWAGIFRKFLVDSPYMWWPANLVQVSLFWALHDGATRPKGGLTRLQFFIVVLVSSFSYYIVPNYLFPSITALSFICWIWKKSVTAQQIGSGLRGLGIGSFALDWSTVAVSYGLSFATLAATLSHVALFYGRTIWQQTKVSFQDKIGDVHTRLMKKNYDVVPQWWFYTILMLVVGLSMLAFEGFGRQLQLPYWGVLSMLAFKCFGTIVASSVYFGTAWWLLSTVQNICDPSKLPQGSPWTCPGDDVFYNASVIWRVVGPPRMFGSLGLYEKINYFFLIGALAPLPVWLLSRKDINGIKWWGLALDDHCPLAKCPTAPASSYFLRNSYTKTPSKSNFEPWLPRSRNLRKKMKLVMNTFDSPRTVKDLTITFVPIVPPLVTEGPIRDKNKDKAPMDPNVNPNASPSVPKLMGDSITALQAKEQRRTRETQPPSKEIGKNLLLQLCLKKTSISDLVSGTFHLAKYLDKTLQY